MRRAALALLAAFAVCGCGAGGGPWVRYLDVSLPGPFEEAGKRAERQGEADPDAGEEVYRLRRSEGDRIAFSVNVRNLTDRDITVIGVEHDEDRDGAFVPDSNFQTVKLPPRARASVAVAGKVRGCRFGGQAVPLAGPELVMRDADGEQTTQQLELDVVIELIVEDGC